MTQSAPVTGPDEPERISTGSTGLDGILGGGFDADRVYLTEGRPGAGKTTLALQFLLEGVRRGERCLYLMLSESERELRTVVQRHVWPESTFSNWCRRKPASTPTRWPWVRASTSRLCNLAEFRRLSVDVRGPAI
jgi:replicative DNA helicase